MLYYFSGRSQQCSFRDFQALDKLGLKSLDTSVSALQRVTWFSMSYGLLANDATLLAVMEQAGLSHLATSDKQLLNIAPFHAWRPDDL